MVVALMLAASTGCHEAVAVLINANDKDPVYQHAIDVHCFYSLLCECRY
jgi:hypothetical protein